MLRRTVLTIALLSLAASTTTMAKDASGKKAENTAAIEAAKSAATDWLKLADAQDAKSSWTRASTAFKSAVTVPEWTKALDSVRKPLGEVRERKDKSARYETSIPGAPDGKYVLLQYQSVFEKKADAVEAVNLVMDPDGAWKVVGYFIK